MRWITCRPLLALALGLGFFPCAPAIASMTNGVVNAGTNGGASHLTNGPALDAEERRRALRADQIRTICVQGGRHICGRVLQLCPDGVVVDSGYLELLGPQFRQSWRVPGTADLHKREMVEANQPGAPCVGPVFLMDLPKKPAVRLYDYVTIGAYPAGQYTYVPVPGVAKKIRRFAVRLPTAVNLELNAGPK